MREGLAPEERARIAHGWALAAHGQADGAVDDRLSILLDLLGERPALPSGERAAAIAQLVEGVHRTTSALDLGPFDAGLEWRILTAVALAMGQLSLSDVVDELDALGAGGATARADLLRCVSTVLDPPREGTTAASGVSGRRSA